MADVPDVVEVAHELGLLVAGEGKGGGGAAAGERGGSGDGEEAGLWMLTAFPRHAPCLHPVRAFASMTSS